MRSSSSLTAVATTISRIVLVTTILFVVAFVANKTLPTTTGVTAGIADGSSSSSSTSHNEQQFILTTKEYSIRDKASIDNACQAEYGVDAQVVDLDHDLPNHKWDTIIQKFEDPANVPLKRFTHYWAKADNDYLDALDKSRGVVLEYLWGSQVEPVLVGDSEMPSFLKVQVLCRISSSKNMSKDVNTTPQERKKITASSYGHFHINTWAGDTLDFYHPKGTDGNEGGSCHFTLVENPNFVLLGGDNNHNHQKGLTIQVRTKSTPMFWSYLEAAVIQIGTDKFQVAGTGDDETDNRPKYWVNDDYRGDISTLNFPVKFHTINARQHVFTIQLDNDYIDQDGNSIATLVKFKTFHKYVRVDIQTTTASESESSPSLLENSYGLMGRFPDGSWMGREDKDLVMDDATEFGKEWIVSNDKSLFTTSSQEEDGDQCQFQIVSNKSGGHHHNHHHGKKDTTNNKGQQEGSSSSSSSSSSSIIGPVTLERRTLLR